MFRPAVRDRGEMRAEHATMIVGVGDRVAMKAAAVRLTFGDHSVPVTRAPVIEGAQPHDGPRRVDLLAPFRVPLGIEAETRTGELQWPDQAEGDERGDSTGTVPNVTGGPSR
ncbi:MAG: hypothetical protein ACRECR_00410 [Thermoplasmata archaeon]